MSDTELLTIGKYVSERMPNLAARIQDASKPTCEQLLKMVSEILDIDLSRMCDDCRDAILVDARIIFCITALQVHDPKKLADTTKKSKMTGVLAQLLNRETDQICEYIKLHNRLMVFNARYRSKFNYVKEAMQ